MTEARTAFIALTMSLRPGVSEPPEGAGVVVVAGVGLVRGCVGAVGVLGRELPPPVHPNKHATLPLHRDAHDDALDDDELLLDGVLGRESLDGRADALDELLDELEECGRESLDGRPLDEPVLGVGSAEATVVGLARVVACASSMS
jgi:hypothetical protein